MTHRLAALATMLSIFVLINTSSAQTIITSFEGESRGPVGLNAGDIASSGFSTTDGVTDGAASFFVVPNDTGATFMLQINLVGETALLDALTANPTIQFDVSIPVDANPADGRTGAGTVSIVNSLVGGFDDSVPGAYYGSFIPYDGTTVTRTVDLTASQVATLSDPTNTYAQVTLGVNIQSDEAGFEPTVYFDNIIIPAVAIPEPSSLALLGMGGIALVGRRRRS